MIYTEHTTTHTNTATPRPGGLIDPPALITIDMTTVPITPTASKLTAAALVLQGLAAF